MCCLYFTGLNESNSSHICEIRLNTSKFSRTTIDRNIYINIYNFLYQLRSMAVITLKIDDDLEEKFRRRVGHLKGATRGAISESVEEAIRLWLSSPDLRESANGKTNYVARKDDRVLARENSLDALSQKLKELKVDPRNVLIVSEPPVQTKRKMGLRTRTRITD